MLWNVVELTEVRIPNPAVAVRIGILETDYNRAPQSRLPVISSIQYTWCAAGNTFLAFQKGPSPPKKQLSRPPPLTLNFTD